MKEYIEREAMVDRFETMIAWCEDNLNAEGLKDFRRGCIATLKDELNYVQKVMPTADVVERKRGEWVGEADGYADGELVYDVWYCSECNHCIDDGTDDPDLLPNFCPNCGSQNGGQR